MGECRTRQDQQSLEPKPGEPKLGVPNPAAPKPAAAEPMPAAGESPADAARRRTALAVLSARRICVTLSQLAAEAWVAVKELKLSYHNGYI